MDMDVGGGGEAQLEATRQIKPEEVKLFGY